LALSAVALLGTPRAALAEQAAGKASPSVAVALPDDAKVTLLIQLHMAALSLANMTGQYAVLHALGTPKFQADNPPDKLAKTFATFREQSIDISPTLIFAPILSGSPRLEGGSTLRMTGWYDTKPNRVLFDLAFEATASNWQLAGIAVRTEAATVGPTASNDAQPQRPSPPPTPEKSKKASKPAN
jgi:hypothetical protein